MGKYTKAEENNDEGKKIYEHYSSIYKKNFLKGNQDDKKILMDEGLDKQPVRAKQPEQSNVNSLNTNSNFRNKKLSASELAILTMNS